jgi:hypothetical protein
VISAAFAYHKLVGTSEILVVAVYSTSFGIHGGCSRPFAPRRRFLVDAPAYRFGFRVTEDVVRSPG